MFNFGKSKRLEVITAIGDQIAPAILVDRYHKQGTMVCSTVDLEKQHVRISFRILKRQIRRFKSDMMILTKNGIEAWIKE